MNLNDLNVILAEAGPPAPATQQDPRAQGMQMLMMIAVTLFLFWFIAIRPQSKKAKEQTAMLKTMRPGDKVLTSSGIVGVVVSVKEKTISLRSAETKLEILKSAVVDITERGSQTGAGEGTESGPVLPLPAERGSKTGASAAKAS